MFVVVTLVAKIVKLYSESFKKRPLLLIESVALFCSNLAVVVLKL